MEVAAPGNAPCVSLLELLFTSSKITAVTKTANTKTTIIDHTGLGPGSPMTGGCLPIGICGGTFPIGGSSALLGYGI